MMDQKESWFSNVPKQSTDTREKPQTILSFLLDEYDKALGEGIIPQFKSKAEPSKKKGQQSKQKDSESKEQDKDSSVEIVEEDKLVMDIPEEEDERDNDPKSPAGSVMDTREKDVQEKPKTFEKTMQKAVAIKIKMENAGGAAKQSRPSTSELAAKLSETISDEDRERFDRDARTGQLTGERLKEGPRPSGGKGSLGFQTVEKSVAKSISTADKEKWDAANLREREENAKGLNNLPLLRMAALAGETTTVGKAKLRLLLELIEAIGKVMPPETHKVTMIGSSAHGLGIQCSDLDISVTPSGKTPGGTEI